MAPNWRLQTVPSPIYTHQSPAYFAHQSQSPPLIQNPNSLYSFSACFSAFDSLIPHKNLTMEIMNNHESVIANPLESVPTNRATIDDLDFNQSFGSYGTETGETSERPSKKPKVEENNVVVEYALPVGFLDPINRERIAFKPQSTVEIDNNPKKTVVVPSLFKQFWKAGDYERPVDNSESSSHQGF